MVTRDAAERERERACDGVLRGRESSSAVCDEIEGERVVCAERERKF